MTCDTRPKKSAGKSKEDCRDIRFSLLLVEFDFMNLIVEKPRCAGKPKMCANSGTVCHWYAP